MQRTGNVYRKVGVVLFGKQYVNNCKYGAYEVETTYKYLYPLNLAIAYNTYYETAQATIACTIDECMDELQALAYEQTLNGCPFTPQDVEYTVYGNTVTATLYAYTDLY